MKPFREENRFYIFCLGFFGLYMRSIEVVTKNKWVIAFFTVWSKLPLALIPIYISWDIHSLVVDEAPLLLLISMIRKVLAFSYFLYKNVIFYLYRDKFEKLIDLWDTSFREELYPETQKTGLLRNIKENMAIVRNTLLLGIIASISYSVPSFFSKNKEFLHPSGFIYNHRSPDFEIAVFFDLCCTMSAVSAAASDSILIIFLTQVRTKLVFLKKTLADMIDELVIDEDGRLLARQSEVNRMETEFRLNDPVIDIHKDSRERSYFSSEDYHETESKSQKFIERVKAFESKLRIWVRYHQDLAGFFQELRVVYGPIVTGQLVFCVAYTALTAFHIVQVRLSFIALGIALVASSNLVSLFMWCKFGAEVEVIHPFGDAFGRAWFLFPKKMKIAFSFIIMRSKKSLTLYGISIYGINFVTFFEFMKLTYQFFAFMVQLTNSKLKMT